LLVACGTKFLEIPFNNRSLVMLIAQVVYFQLRSIADQ
jgi:hypothetical protein